MTLRTGLSATLLASFSLLLLTAVGCDETQSLPPDQGSADASDQSVSDGIIPDTPPEQATPDQATPDQTPSEQATPDQATPDQAPPDQAPPDQLLPDQASPDLLVPDQALPDLPPPDQFVPDQALPDMPLPSCTDGIQNGDETDTDCGGATCPACAASQKCTLPADCVSGVCTAGLCQKASCTDSVKNGDETDTDCGGATCPACAASQKCKLPADCKSGVCTAGVCQKASCTDSVKNGDETDVDCGGGVCAKCVEKKKCKVTSDCKSGVCTAGVCHPPAHKIAAGKTVYFEDLAAIAQVKAISGTKITVESATAAAKFAAGLEVLLINMQGTSTDAASVGNYELLQVASVATADVVLNAAPARVYGDNKSNTSFTKQKVFLVQVLRYSTLTIDGALAAKAWTGTSKGLGLVVVRATVKLEVASVGAVTTSSTGYRSASYSCNGVSGLPGESMAPMPANVKGQCYHNNPTGKPNFGGGGGGLSNCNTYSCATQSIGAGGGGGSYGAMGVAGLNNGSKQKGGLAGLLYGKADLSQIFLGSGGGTGAGGYSGPGSGTYGGQGGGLIFLLAPTLVIKGSVTANGKQGGINGSCGITHGSGSGGGGAGGSVYLSGQTVTLTAGKVTALGAKGGCKGGGAAGNGRVRVDYSTLNGVAFPGGSGALTIPVAYMAKP